MARLHEIFQLIETVNKILEKQGAHSLSYVDTLFTLKDEQKITTHPNDKRFCMAELLDLYFVNEEIPADIPKPTDDIQQIFRPLENI